jgi:hypothetical protein
MGSMNSESTLNSGEPTPGYVVRGPYADGTFRVFRRYDDGAQHFMGSADDYEAASDLAVSLARAVA